ncbi:MAG TPA: hypothetical protein VH590_08880, partial [Ktedonobacterales bacterium]
EPTPRLRGWGVPEEGLGGPGHLRRGFNRLRGGANRCAVAQPRRMDEPPAGWGGPPPRQHERCPLGERRRHATPATLP